MLAARFDLKVFFEVVAKPVAAMSAVDVLGFITAQHNGARCLPEPGVRALPGTGGCLFAHDPSPAVHDQWVVRFLAVRGDVPANPVPRGLPTRRERGRPSQGVPLVRAPRRTLPRILTPAEVDTLTVALRTHRDRAMVAAMVLGRLRRCEVLGLRLGDVNAGERQLFISDGKGGSQRMVRISPRFFEHLAAYLDVERPADADTDAV